MYHFLHAIMVIALLAPTAVPQEQSVQSHTQDELKTFEFLEFVAGEPMPSSFTKRCGKKPDTQCVFPLTKISNVYVGMMVTSYQGKLATLYLDANPLGYDDLMQAFIKKYGEPCSATISKWSNALGVTLDNPTALWCFKTGKLLVSKYGSRLDKMAIFYEDENHKPDREPEVNF